MFKLATPIVQWSGFLDQPMIESCRDAVRANIDKFVPTTTTTGEDHLRKSVVLWHWHYPDLTERFTSRIMELLPIVRHEMQEYCIQTPPSKIEVQLTNHYRNGDLFKRHVDNASTVGQTTDTPNRRVTCVYYFSMHEENHFKDGDLFVHLANGTSTIKPIHNSVVFFPSHVYHEVQPIQSDTENFMDGRFTLNCWIHG